MKRLEEEMVVTNKEIEAMEEELEARYMLLEEEAEEFLYTAQRLSAGNC